MPLGSIITLTCIVAAFVVFAVILAWGDYQTSRLVDEKKQPLGQKDQRQVGRAVAQKKLILSD